MALKITLGQHCGKICEAEGGKVPLNNVIQEMENALLRIKSVLGAKIVTDQKGEIVEVHILATDQRNPKQVVRDVESTLLVKFGRKVDHKKIGVVQQSEKEAERPLEGRLKFVGINTAPGEQNFFEVVLRDPSGIEHPGQVFIRDPLQRLQAMGQAAVAAVNHFLGKEKLHLQGIYMLRTAEMPFIISSVLYRGGKENLVLAGAAPVRGSEEEAAVKSVLSAINRLLPKMVEEKI